MPDPFRMRIISSQEELQSATSKLRRPHGLGGVLIPTMGALHAGHAALIAHGSKLAKQTSSPCVVSIFVNPTQFNEKADFDRYPRTLDVDLAICKDSGADYIFAPMTDTMYPTTPAAPIPPLPSVAVTPNLEDGFRPGHFAGVCQVVLRLFKLLNPDAANFGEKDWQQLQVIAAMTREARLPITIIPHPTLRDPDGLAMSSRNRFLSPDERRAALAIPHALQAAANHSTPEAAEAVMRSLLATSGLTVEYAVIRDAQSLGPVAGKPGRALIAARSGKTRLIDNAPWPG